mmetsp:Transcript_26671/g.57978  ORF Transcript_26671/g.57978 Transcript_26671/m.57978 type:complete len:90 (-) Transcript_26671:846-1115(-)
MQNSGSDDALSNGYSIEERASKALSKALPFGSQTDILHKSGPQKPNLPFGSPTDILQEWASKAPFFGSHVDKSGPRTPCPVQERASKAL